MKTKTLGGTPPTEIRVVKYGRVKLWRATLGRDFDFTIAAAQKYAEWFRGIGREVMIDYNHESLRRADAPAAGWIGGVEARDDGLWFTGLRFTERAAAAIAAGELRYCSPTLFWKDEAYTNPDGLGPLSLTNNPATVGAEPIVAAAGATILAIGDLIEIPTTAAKRQTEKPKMISAHLTAVAAAMKTDISAAQTDDEAAKLLQDAAAKLATPPAAPATKKATAASAKTEKESKADDSQAPATIPPAFVTAMAAQASENRGLKIDGLLAADKITKTQADKLRAEWCDGEKIATALSAGSDISADGFNALIATLNENRPGPAAATGRTGKQILPKTVAASADGDGASDGRKALQRVYDKRYPVAK